jgi:hypothetical protein
MAGDAPKGSWPADDLRHLDGSREVEVSAARMSGVPGRWRPIWVVVADGEVFVRTWHRRTTGWYGRAVESGHAWIRMSSGLVDAIVTVAGDTDADVIDAAYRAKYGAAGAESMVTAEAAASTLRLTRAA